MGRLIWLLVFLFFIALYLLSRKGRKIRDAEGRRPIGSLPGPQQYNFDIVGESFCQDNLEKICGGLKPCGHQLKETATIIPYDTNPKDDKAVRVEVNDLTVGHLDKESARNYRRQLEKNGVAGKVFTCNALIVGGWDRGNGDTGYFGVKLDLPTS